jgi:polyferredoxin
MLEIIKQCVDAFVNLKPKESMEDQQKKNSSEQLISQDLMTILLIIFIILLLVFVLGKYCWNNYLVEAVPGIKPLTSITQFVAIWFVAQTLFTK